MAEVLAPENQDYFGPKPIRRPSPSPTFLVGSSSPFASELQQKLQTPQQSDRTSPQHSSYSSAPASIHSSHVNLHQSSSSLSTPSTSFSTETSDSEDDIGFPKYGDDSASDRSDDQPDRPSSPQHAPNDTSQKTSSQTTPTNTPDPNVVSFDDTSMREEPIQQVDYLSHEWTEQDIWSSWRYIISRRRVYGERSRLENASWRTWAKQMHKLKTVTPETLNWLKDCDVTWLYGPLQTGRSRRSGTTSNISKSNSFLSKKPILKKRSMSEVMLQKSLSTSTLVKEAAAAVKAQENVHGGSRTRDRPHLNERATSDYVGRAAHFNKRSHDPPERLSSKSTSGMQTPADGEKRHIRFDEKVEQCIAVDGKDDDEEEDVTEEDNFVALKSEDESSSDDGMIMMKSERRRSLSRSNSRSSLSGESKTIAMLPSTTLKYRIDSPVISTPPSHSINTHQWRAQKLSPSASQETLRPANPATNFLLPGDDSSDDDLSWEPSGAFSNRIDSLEQLDRQYSKAEPRDLAREYSEPAGGLRRTESGMFMPFEDEEEAAINNGLIGRVMDGVNTARDIAHVIWNVGWRVNQ